MTTILKKPKSNRAFHELVREMGDDVRLVYHSEVRWLSRWRVIERVWKLREKLVVWFNGREEHRDNMIQNLFLLARLAFLVDIYSVCLTCSTSPYKDVELIYLKRLPKLHHSNKNLKVWKKKSAATTYKIWRRFSPSCLHVSGKQNRIWSSVSSK